MKNKKNKKAKLQIAIIIAACYLIFAFYAFHVGYLMEEERLDLVSATKYALGRMVTRPFDLVPFPSNVLLALFVITALGLLFAFMSMSSAKLKKHDDLTTIAGDAKLMSQKELDNYNIKKTEPFGKPYAEGRNNDIMSNDIFLSIQTGKTNVTRNVLGIGGTGSGKSFRLIGPNILQRNSSYVITDPSGGLYKSYAPFLEHYGYKVKLFNLDRMEQSCHYNPFNYIHSDKDIEILVTMLIANTSSPQKGGDDFWEKCEIALLCALIAYLFHYKPKKDQNFSTVKNLIRIGGVDENDSSSESPLDLLFKPLRDSHPDCFALTQYDTFRLGAGKTLKSILISCSVRLQAFDLEDVRTLTDTDNIELDKIADEKTALFIQIPTGENTFGFLAGLMYSQLFTQLYRYCENTAEYGYVVLDDENEVVRTFRANTKNEMKDAENRAQEYVKLYDNAVIVQNEKFTTKDNDGKTSEFWEIRAGSETGQLLGFRGSKKEAEKAIASVKKGKILANAKRGNDGQRCPIHVRFLLDEFANTGKIPDFCEKISTIRKYEISTTIILQSIKQIQNLYEKEWDVITANCDTLIYLGGGPDDTTTKWLSDIAGDTTVVDKADSFSKSGSSTSINRKSQKLFSQSKLRTMDRLYCVVVPRSENPCFGEMYDTPRHPEWKLAKSFPPYEFSEEKYLYIKNTLKDPDEEEQEEAPKEATVKEETPEEKAYREEENEKAKQKAGEVENNMDIENEEKTSSVDTVTPEDKNSEKSEEMDKLLNDTFGSTDDETDSDESVSDESFDDLCMDMETSEISFGAQGMA